MTSHLTLSVRAERARALAAAALASGDLEQLDALIAAAATALGADIASLSMLSDRQITVSSCGIDAPAAGRGAETPFDNTICATALRSDEPLAIQDARADARVSSIPAVRGGMVGAYLGIPIRVDDTVVGVVCVVSREPRRWTEEHLTTLDSYATKVLQELTRLAAPPGDA
jgi:GAF domain-containing protein